MDTNALAKSLIECTDDVACCTGHSGLIERQVIAYLKEHPELTKSMLVKWQAANPGLVICQVLQPHLANSQVYQPLDFSK